MHIIKCDGLEYLASISILLTAYMRRLSDRRSMVEKLLVSKTASIRVHRSVAMASTVLRKASIVLENNEASLFASWARSMSSNGEKRRNIAILSYDRRNK